MTPKRCEKYRQVTRRRREKTRKWHNNYTDTTTTHKLCEKYANIRKNDTQITHKYATNNTQLTNDTTNTSKRQTKYEKKTKKL
jgi:hypothetical protein